MRNQYPLVLILLVVGLLALSHAPLWAQGNSNVDERLRVAMDEGVEALRQNDQRRAVQLLEKAFLDSLSYMSSEYGSGAYWLGRAYADDDQIEHALRVWRSGLLTLESLDRFSIRLADAFITEVFKRERQQHYGLATEAYRELLQQLGTSSSPNAVLQPPEGRKRMAQRLRHLALVLPEDVRRQAGLPASDADITPEIVSSVQGSRLLKWWRGSDPLPATRENELIRDHLRRVSYALENYSHSETLYGFDERGEIYVRLGPPDEEVTINFSDTRLTDLIYERKVGVDVSLSDFPNNEFWSYGSVDRRTYYIFVEEERGGPFRIGTIEDLLPKVLRRGYQSSGASATARETRTGDRGMQRSVYALAALRAIYRKYSPFHPNLAKRHDDVANYLSYVLTGGREQFGDNSRSPGTFAQQTLAETRNRDHVAAQDRAKYTPRQISTARREEPRLNVKVRTARFLNDNGSTRTEVYWAPEAGALAPNEKQREELQDQGYSSFGDHLIRLTATQQAPDYQDRIVNREHYRITKSQGEDVTIPARTLKTQRGDTTQYHLALQWDQYLVATKKGEVGPKVKVAVRQRDSLSALAKEGTLEMSDIKPVVLSEEGGTLQERSLPYPFDEITKETPLALYFEVYNLSFGSEDETQYTIEYQVEGKANRGAIARLFRGDDVQQTVVSTTTTGSSRTAEEYIRLDVENWDLKTDTDMTVTVMVTDEVTGEQVARSIDFQIAPSE